MEHGIETGRAVDRRSRGRSTLGLAPTRRRRRQGRITARCAGAVSLARCSGSADVRATGDVDLAFDGLNGDVRAASGSGNVAVSLAPEVGADVALEGATVDVTAAPAFAAASEAPGFVEGTLVAAPRAPSRRGAGKVAAAAADDQRWDSAVTADASAAPRVAAAAPRGAAVLRTLSWIDSIRRQCGLPEGFERVRRGEAAASSASSL